MYIYVPSTSSSSKSDTSVAPSSFKNGTSTVVSSSKKDISVMPSSFRNDQPATGISKTDMD